MKKHSYWTDELIQQEALKYKTRWEFSKNERGAVKAARKKGIYEEVVSHMPKKVHKKRVWTKEKILNEASKYTSFSDFRDKSRPVYNKASEYNLLNEVFKILPKTKVRKWTKDRIQVEALKYNKKSEFMRMSGSAYNAAIKANILDEVTTHMEVLRVKRDYDSLKKEALSFKTFKSFIQNNQPAYLAASRMGILDEICYHMERGKSGFDDKKKAFLYYISVNGGEAYKIGITNKSVNERFSIDELNSIKVVKVWTYDIGLDARREEKRILKEFAYAKYKGEKMLNTGNTELFDRDILGLDYGN